MEFVSPSFAGFKWPYNRSSAERNTLMSIPASKLSLPLLLFLINGGCFGAVWDSLPHPPMHIAIMTTHVFTRPFEPLEGVEPSSSANRFRYPTTLTKTISPSVGSSCCSLLHHKDFLSFSERKLAHLAYYRHQDEVSRYGYVKHGCYHGCYHVPNSLCSDHG